MVAPGIGRPANENNQAHENWRPADRLRVNNTDLNLDLEPDWRTEGVLERDVGGAELSGEVILSAKIGCDQPNRRDFGYLGLLDTICLVARRPVGVARTTSGRARIRTCCARSISAPRTYAKDEGVRRVRPVSKMPLRVAGSASQDPPPVLRRMCCSLAMLGGGARRALADGIVRY